MKSIDLLGSKLLIMKTFYFFNSSFFKKRLTLGLLLILIVQSLSASTTIPAGNVSGTWDLSSSPYLITGDITIPSGETLTIEPGVVVEFQNWYRLIVNGTIQAIGTSLQQIVFTATPPGPGEPGWPGIDFIDASGNSTLQYCIIENGQSIAADPNDRGGAIYLLNSSPEIKHCTMRNIRVRAYGAAIYCDNSSPLIEGCTITDNLVGYYTSGAGGAIYCTNNSQPQIISNIISHNAVSTSGGFSAANSLGGGIYLNHSDATIRENVISYNTVHAEGNVPSHARGGAIYSYYSNPVLTGNTIYGNETSVYSSPGEGGGIYIYGGNVYSVNNIFWNDSPEEFFFSSTGLSSITVAYSDLDGGEQSIVTSSYSTVNWQEGNMKNDPKLTDPANDDYSLQSNSQVIDAGTAYYEWQGAVLVDLNTADYNGTAPDMGAIESGNSSSVNQTPVAMATANPDHGSAPLTVSFSSDGSYDPDGTIVSYAWDFGDGTASTEQNPSHTYTDVNQYSARLTVTDDQNATNTKAIIIDVQDGTTLFGGDVSGNWTLSGSPYRIEGNITIPTGTTLTIDPGVTVEFKGWYKLLVNGQIHASGTDTQSILFTSTPPGPGEPGWLGLDFVNADDGSLLEHCIIENCMATAAEPNDRGGALYIVNSNPVVKQSILRNNQVVRYGGAIYIDNGNPSIENCDIINNSAGSYAYAGGGAIYCTNSSQPILNGNTISYNSTGASGGFSAATATGGAIHINQSDATITGNIISFNSAGASGNVPTYARGGAIYISGSNPVITGNTIYGNSVSANNQAGQGGGIYIYNSYPLTVNNIIWNNSSQEIYLASSYTPSSLLVAYSDVDGGQNAIVLEDTGNVYWQEGNISYDPTFTDAANIDFSLQSNSPAIDAGTANYNWQGNTVVNIDATQYQGNAPDMGALESGFTAPINLSPVAVASANPVSGEAPLTVQFNSDGSYDPDGTISSFLWSSGSISIAEPNPSYTFSNPGTYVITLEVTDNDGATDTDVVSIEVTAPVVYETHVGAQTITREYSRRKWYAVDQVLILDQDDQPVANAYVTVNYDGPTRGTVTGQTDHSGLVDLQTRDSRRPKGSWCFEVTDVTKTDYTYQPIDNVVTTQCETTATTKSAKITGTGDTGIFSDTETQIYPNPFRNSLTLEFKLEQETPVSIQIFDINGRVVKLLVNHKTLSKGIHSMNWDGNDDNGNLLKKGLYFLRLQINDSVETYKLIHTR